jgi:hydroxymethylglutaryl-CoA reductase
MISEKPITGFSKLSREEQIRIAAAFASDPAEFAREMQTYWHTGLSDHERYAEYAENAVSIFCLPYSLAPNFKINGKDYVIPMVTEESSVVAAAASAAKFWWPRGGFETRVRKMLKSGHIHFLWNGSPTVIESFIENNLSGLRETSHVAEQSMRARGGGIGQINLVNLTDSLTGYYQLEVLFDTRDAMGANFINTCLETMTGYLMKQAEEEGIAGNLEIIMSILSNYTPQCLVECRVTCNIAELEFPESGMTAEMFVHRFETAVSIARNDVNRAVTHNKGIFNGIDAVILATGNDFRAVEAAGHAWAAKDGRYKSLTKTIIKDNRFIFKLELPMAVGVTGGLTNLHPLAQASLRLLDNPSAEQLMSIIASVGMANHFSALKALVTGGIQHGHMKLHLNNMLIRLGASSQEKVLAAQYFKDRRISYADLRDFISRQRSVKNP